MEKIIKFNPQDMDKFSNIKWQMSKNLLKTEENVKSILLKLTLIFRITDLIF